MTDAQKPALSVLVTVVDGGQTLVRCLDALRAQVDAPSMEVIVPFDVTISETGALRERFPDFIFLDLGALLDHDPRDEFEQHELYDRRRSGGLLTTKADLVAIIEDRGWPRPDWAKQIVAATQKYPEAVIGGAVESAARNTALWAIFFLDFGRYQAPFDSEKPDYVTDTNICYRRDALFSVQHLWEQVYREATVNWAIRDQGLGLRLTPGPVVVQQREPVALSVMLKERYHWARIFGHARARGVPLMRRLIWTAATPILPFVLYLRHVRRQFRLKRHRAELFAATPLMFVLLFVWCAGEAQGYLTAPKDA